MERQGERPRRSTLSWLVNSDEVELRPTHTYNTERRNSELLAFKHTNRKQGENGVHDAIHGMMNMREQRENVGALNNRERVAQNVFTNFGNTVGPNSTIATTTHPGLNHPTQRFLVDAYSANSRLQGLGGYTFNHRGGQTIPRIPLVSQRANPPFRYCPGFPPRPSIRRLPKLPLPQEESDVAPRLRPLLPENVTHGRSIRSIGVLSKHKVQKLPEHGLPVQPGPSGSEQTFNSLIEIVLNHPMFPLIFKGVCETTTGQTPIIDNTRSKVLLEQTIEKLKEYETLCRETGSLNAQRFMNCVDLCFAVFNAAFQSLQSDEQPPIPEPFHSMIFASGRHEGAKATAPTSEFSSHFNRRTTDTHSKRAKPSAAARKRLDNWFKVNYKNPYPTPEQKKQLAHECGVAMEQVCALRFMVQR